MRFSGASLLAFALAIGPARAQSVDPDCHENAMIVLDASQSMYQLFDAGRSRIEAARMAARRVVPSAARNRSLGLMTFGPGLGDQCSNISVKVPVQRDAAAPILAQMDKIITDGGTPLTGVGLPQSRIGDCLDYGRRRDLRTRSLNIGRSIFAMRRLKLRQLTRTEQSSRQFGFTTCWSLAFQGLQSSEVS